MKSKITTYLFEVVAIMFLGGCGDAVVDLQPKDQLTTDIALSTLDGLEGSILGVYERGRNHLESNDVCLYNVCQTDLVKAGSHLADQAIFRAFFLFDADFNGSNGGIKTLFDAAYIGLSRCNIIIEGIDNVEFAQTENNLARKNRVLGEAYFFRAYFHLNLVERWENIVLADKVASDPNAEVKLADPADVYNLIVSDLETAIDLLPEAAVVNSAGRISRATARHLLSKAHMDLGNWSEASALAEAVCNDPHFELLTNLEEVFGLDTDTNKEVIFAWNFLYDAGSHPQRVTQQFYPLYDRVNGVARSFEQGGRPWARLHPSDYYWTLFEENDKRLDAWHKRFWYYDVNTDDDPVPAGKSIGDKVVSGEFTDIANLGDLAIVPTTNKYWEDGSLGKVVDDAEGYRNIIQYRLSEAYLIAAEAYWRAGDESKALSFINKIRQRAGVSDLTSLSQDVILDEHARELGHEGHRWTMLKRMGILVERVKAHNPDAAINVQEYHTKWPIPRGFVDLTKVEQNPGYSE